MAPANLGKGGEVRLPEYPFLISGTPPLVNYDVRGDIIAENSTMTWTGGAGALWKICDWRGCPRLPAVNITRARPTEIVLDGTIHDCKEPLASGERCDVT